MCESFIPKRISVKTVHPAGLHHPDLDNARKFVDLIITEKADPFPGLSLPRGNDLWVTCLDH